MKLTCSTLPPPELVGGRIKTMKASLLPKSLPRGGKPGVKADFALFVKDVITDYIDTEGSIVLLEENSAKSTKNLRVKTVGIGSRRRGLNIVLDTDTLRNGNRIDSREKSKWPAISLKNFENGLVFKFGLQINNKRHVVVGTLIMSPPKKTGRFGRGLKQLITGSTDYYFSGNDKNGRRIVFHFKSQAASRVEREDAYQLQDVQIYLPDNWDGLQDNEPTSSYWGFTYSLPSSTTTEPSPPPPPLRDDELAQDYGEFRGSSIDRARLMALGRYLGELNQSDVSAEITHHCNANMDQDHYRTVELSEPIQSAIQQYYF